jgi:hypothetical protein
MDHKTCAFGQPNDDAGVLTKCSMGQHYIQQREKGNTLFWWTLAKGTQWGPFQLVYTPFSPNIITDTDMRYAHRSSSENQKGKNHLKDLEADGTTMLKRVWRQYVEVEDRICLAKDGIQVERHTNMAINFQFCTKWVTSACQHGLRGAG